MLKSQCQIMLSMMTITLLSSCASPRLYRIDSTPDNSAPELAALARSAARGNKQSQLRLGFRYEGGIGVAQDLGCAEVLYAAAAAKTGGAVLVYESGKRSVMARKIYRGPENNGLAEAGRALKNIRARRATQIISRRGNSLTCSTRLISDTKSSGGAETINRDR